MRKQIKSALLGVAVALAATSSQAATYNGDLIVGFSSGSGNDFVYDLGSGASLFNGEQWNLSSFLGAYNLSTVNWGVVGNTLTSGTGRLIYTTRGVTPNNVAGAGAGNGINTADGAIYQPFALAGAGQSASVLDSNPNSWGSQTINPSLSTQYKNVYGNPNTVGISSIALWQVQANNSAPAQLLNFSLDNTGTLTYGVVAVPEPATYGLLAGAGLLVVSLRNQLRRKQA